MFSYLWGHFEACQESRIHWFLHAFSNVFRSSRSLRRLAGSAECIDFYMIWAMFSYLLGHLEDCQESRMYWFLDALSNVFLSLRSLRGLPGEPNVLIFTCFQQCFLSSRSLRRLAGSAECIDFYMIWAMFSYLLGHFEDCQESRMYWFLHVLSNVFLSLRSLWGLPGEQNVLIFIWFQQYFPIF